LLVLTNASDERLENVTWGDVTDATVCADPVFSQWTITMMTSFACVVVSTHVPVLVPVNCPVPFPSIALLLTAGVGAAANNNCCVIGIR